MLDAAQTGVMLEASYRHTAHNEPLCDLATAIIERHVITNYKILP